MTALSGYPYEAPVNIRSTPRNFAALGVLRAQIPTHVGLAATQERLTSVVRTGISAHPWSPFTLRRAHPGPGPHERESAEAQVPADLIRKYFQFKKLLAMKFTTRFL